MKRKLKSGYYRLYSKKLISTTGKRRNIDSFKTRSAMEKYGRDVQYFKHH